MDNFKFFKQIPNFPSGNITPNFPLGAGQVDFGSVKKNLPHFEELAESFGLTQAKSAILRNTLNLAASIPAQKNSQNRQFPSLQDGPDNPLPSIGSSVFGTPVYSDLNITGASYSDNNGKTIASFKDISIIACIFEIDRDTTIIETNIQGRDNDVNEYISARSWKISCKGRVLPYGNTNIYPRTDVDNLMRALNSNISLQVNSWFLNMAGIYNILVKKRNFPQEEGSQGYQKFEFEAKADYSAPKLMRQAAGLTT